MKHNTVLSASDITQARQKETSHYLHTLLSNLSMMELKSPDLETQKVIDEQKNIFNFLFDTLSHETQSRLVLSSLSSYKPIMALERFENLIGNFLYNDNGIEDAVYHPNRRTPLLTYLYELENDELFVWAKKKYKLDVQEEYTLIQSFKIKNEKGALELRKEEYTSNLLDSIFNRFVHSLNNFSIDEASIKKLIDPLDIKTFKTLKASNFLLKKINNINFLNNDRKNAYSFQKIEYFLSFLSDKKHPFVANGLISNCQTGIFSEANKEPYIKLISKAKNDYAQALSDKQKYQIDGYAVDKAIKKLTRQTGLSLSQFRKELSAQYREDDKNRTQLAPQLKSKMNDTIKSELDSLVSTTFQDLCNMQFIPITEFEFMTKISDYLSKEASANYNTYRNSRYVSIFNVPPEAGIHNQAELSPEFLESVALHLSTFCSQTAVKAKALKI